jgi:hypothetical protein
MNAIEWPDNFIPGFTDNFVSNEMILPNLNAENVWPWLINAHRWPEYYSNSAKVKYHASCQSELTTGVRFSFETFGFLVEALCVECIQPNKTTAGRIAWWGWSGEQGENSRLDVHHAWLVENLTGNRLRILTQETQQGEPAKTLAVTRPNPMLNGHQDWLDGLIKIARKTAYN